MKAKIDFSRVAEALGKAAIASRTAGDSLKKTLEKINGVIPMQVNNTTFKVGDKIQSTLIPDMFGVIIKFNDDGSALIKVEKRRIIGDLFYWKHVDMKGE